MEDPNYILRYVTSLLNKDKSTLKYDRLRNYVSFNFERWVGDIAFQCTWVHMVKLESQNKHF